MTGGSRLRRRAARALAAAALLALPLSALGEEWTSNREIRCRDDLPGCRVLQMVMMGSFDADAQEDAVSRRVLASAYPRLLEVTDADIAHFAGEFGEDGEAARLRWYRALANCLEAEIAQEIQPGPARRVLALFLDPADTPEGAAARAEIRGEMSAAVLERIAADIEAPVDFVRWVIENGE